MDTRKIAAEYRLSHWMHVLKEQQCSGQNIKDFCQEKGISRNTFFYWQRKLRKAACVELVKLEEPVNCVPEGWMQFAPTQQTKTTLDIEVGGCHITVDAETDPGLLKKVCCILREL